MLIGVCIGVGIIVLWIAALWYALLKDNEEE